MWIDKAADDVLRAWLKHCPAMKLVTTMDGKIVWANPAFSEWSQYTLNELIRLTWRDISGPDKNLEGDFDETRVLDAWNPTYTVKKQYQPKQSQPQWGQLTVMRYPLTGDIQYLLCTWEPLRNGTATAFALAMEGLTTIDKRIEVMSTDIKALGAQPEDEKWLISTKRLAFKYPKTTAAIIAFALSVGGMEDFLSLLNRFGVGPVPPPPVVIEKADR